jgi:sigma-B regulation protein RsbQ
MINILQRNNVHVIGQGQQFIVLAHGFGCDQNVWQGLTEAFQNDYKLVLFDYVGAGQSDLSAYDVERYSTLEGYAKDIIEIGDRLQIEGAIFVGHSVSSMIGVIAANERPELFSKLVFLGPSPRYLNDVNYTGGFSEADLEELFEMMDNNYLGWSQAMAPAIMANPDKPELGETLTNSFCATDPDIAKRFARVTFRADNRSDLTKLTIPSLTLQCREDIIAPLSVGEYIREHAPLNQMVILEATGHCSHMSAPQETVRAIKAFIAD